MTEEEGGRGTLEAKMSLLTTAARLRAGPYPIQLEPGDMIKDGERVIHIKDAAAVTCPEDAEELLKV